MDSFISNGFALSLVNSSEWPTFAAVNKLDLKLKYMYIYYCKYIVIGARGATQEHENLLQKNSHSNRIGNEQPSSLMLTIVFLIPIQASLTLQLIHAVFKNINFRAPTIHN